ncbi:MAG: glycosyltransferase family 2 protein [Planctomycetota bacterium]
MSRPIAEPRKPDEATPRPQADGPTLSFAIPVRNGEDRLPRLLDSLLGQDFTDLEVVIADNRSDDGTQALCERYADADPRVRYFRNPEDIGQVANFNRVLELSRGRYVRWIGVDDWLEPGYASACVAELEAHPEAVGVTTYQDHTREDTGEVTWTAFTGERLESPSAARRFLRMMWFFQHDFRFIDPIYSMMRRDALLRTGRLQVVPNMDMVLSAEMGLQGTFRHVPSLLAHRALPAPKKLSRVLKAYHPERHKELWDTWAGNTRPFYRLIDAAGLGPWDRFVCRWSVRRYALRFWFRRTHRRIRAALGLYKEL